MTSVTKLGVTVCTGLDVTVEGIEKLQPDVVVLATGGVPVVPKSIPGIDKPQVCTAPDVILGKIRPKNKTAVVIGSGMTGLETAEFLLQDGCDTTIIEMAPEIAPGTWFQLVDDEMERLVPAGCKFMAGTKLLEIGDDAVSVEDVKTGKQSLIPADAVVLSMGVRPIPDLEKDLKAKGLNVVRIGDAVKSGTIANAVHSAYNTAVAL